MLGRLSAALGLLAVMTASASSQVVQPAAPVSAPATSGVALKTSQALINGSAVDITSAPVANATVRLRNLAENKIEQVVVSNEAGQFTFVARPEVPYVIEVADETGRLLGVGDVIIVQAGEVAAALVSIPSQVPAMAGFFGQTATSLLAAVTTLGVTVVDPEPPLSPEK
jgi:hypothetical protein